MAIKFGGKSLGPKAKKAGNTETKTVFLIFREQGTLKSIKILQGTSWQRKENVVGNKKVMGMSSIPWKRY